MFGTQLSTQVVVWERKLEIEDERRSNQRREPYVNYLAAPQHCHKARQPLWSRLAGLFRRTRPAPAPAEYPVCCPE